MHPTNPGSVAANAPALPLVEIILLKWLLAGEGIRIHVEQLQSDPCYALRALDEAAACASPSLRGLALRLRSRLQPAA